MKMKTKGVAAKLALLTLLCSGSALAGYDGVWRSPLWAPDGTRPDAQGDCLGGNGGTKPSSCIWHEVRHDYSEGPAVVVGDTYYNCNSKVANSFNITYMYQSSSSVTVEHSQSSTASFDLKGEFSDAVSATLGISNTTSSSKGYTTGKTSTVSQMYTVNVPAHQKAFLTFIPKYRRSFGWLEVNYGHKIYGHYYWYYSGKGSSDVVALTPLYQVGTGTALGVIKPVYVSCKG
ncbi:hypothetical protein RA263_02570 [Pseudomonas syringae pv. tagetis]|uniref:Secreted protein n=1 Tax=Pseudomonas syringae pv. tagetis TaxID=129140 RepID=A0ABW7NJV8_9PSED|nr:hypothetical protein [Pseudomonas syringae group genomosp. 7]RMR02575.1 hypothetical protein ALP93_200287 [Pseudomonas syringae pv. helianthi]UNB61768.1 hypothetical protein MME54_19290 [Pseudomonas syringae pv. helianthi]UNB70015.1 hypothetical protein MME58_07215 [Pseudomonas syringae pv. tagetis]